MCSHSTRSSDIGLRAAARRRSHRASIERRQDLVGVGRLGQVVRRAAPHGFDRRRDAAVAGQHDDARGRIGCFELRDQVEAAAVRHPQVEHARTPAARRAASASASASVGGLRTLRSRARRRPAPAARAAPRRPRRSAAAGASVMASRGRPDDVGGQHDRRRRARRPDARQGERAAKLFDRRHARRTVPVPCPAPGGLVVKNGSPARAERRSATCPRPRSVDRRRARGVAARTAAVTRRARRPRGLQPVADEVRDARARPRRPATRLGVDAMWTRHATRSAARGARSASADDVRRRAGRGASPAGSAIRPAMSSSIRRHRSISARINRTSSRRPASAPAELRASLELARRDGNGPERRAELVRGAGGERRQAREARARARYDRARSPGRDRAARPRARAAPRARR